MPRSIRSSRRLRNSSYTGSCT